MGASGTGGSVSVSGGASSSAHGGATALSAGKCPSGKLLMYDGASCELEAGLYHGGAGLVSQSH